MRTQWRCDSGADPTRTSSWLPSSWLTERQRHGSPGSVIPGAAAPSFSGGTGETGEEVLSAEFEADRDERDGLWFEVFGTSNPDLQPSDFSLLTAPVVAR
jgi:hypothetical protein